MNRSIAFLLLSAALVAFHFPGLAQETPLDPRLKEILKEVEALRGELVAIQQERKAKYIDDLKALEKQTQSTGDLDKVLQVSTERTAWESGSPTPPMDPKDEGILLELRKLRYYFDEDFAGLVAIQEGNSAQRRAQITEKFAGLERTLTTEGKIPEALKTRELKDQFVSGLMTSSSVGTGTPAVEPPVSTSMATPSTASPTEGTMFPLPDPDGYPALPTKKGRIVFVRTSGEKIEFNETALNGIMKDDHDDIVALGDLFSEVAVCAIRADGRPVCWMFDGRKIDPRNVSAVKVWNAVGVPMLWVDKDGKARGIDTAGGLENALRALGKVRYLSPTHNFVFAIDAAGTRHLLGNVRDHPNVVRAFEKKEDVVEAHFGGATYITVLRSDGSAAGFVNEDPPNEYAPPQTYSSLPAFRIGRTPEGEVNALGPNLEFFDTIRDQVDGKLIRVKREGAGTHFAIQAETGKWYIFEAIGNQRVRSEESEIALAGAIDIYPTKAGFVALLPSESVPRSGIWEIEELTAARR